MRKLKIIEHISLDGVIQHSADDGDFPYSDWTAPYRTPAGREAMLAAYGGSFDLLLGRRTYDIWSGFWPKAPSSPMADGLNAATKFIATHRPESPAGRLSGPVGHGKALLCGGNLGTLVRACQHKAISVRHHLQYLQCRRAFEDGIVRRRVALGARSTEGSRSHARHLRGMPGARSLPDWGC
jgi:hypothetical protein